MFYESISDLCDKANKEINDPFSDYNRKKLKKQQAYQRYIAECKKIDEEHFYESFSMNDERHKQ